MNKLRSWCSLLLFIALFLVVLEVRSSLASVSTSSLNKGLVGYWPLSSDFSQSGNTISDASAYGNTATNVGCLFSSDEHGTLNQSLSLDGTTQYINCDTAVNDIETSSVFSYFCRVKFQSVSGTQRIMSLSDTDAADTAFFDLWLSAGKIVGGSKLSATWEWAVQSDSSISAGQWYSVGLVQNGTSPVIYIDGYAVPQTFTQSGDKTYAPSDTSDINVFRLGMQHWNNIETNYLNGFIQEARLYNRALSAAEMQLLHDRYAKSISTSSLNKGLVGQWKLSSEAELVGSTNVLSNPSFEAFTGTPDDANTDAFTSWSHTSSGGGQRQLAVTDKQAGTYAIKITNDSGTAGEYQDFSTTAGKRYKIVLWAKADSGSLGVVLYPGGTFSNSLGSVVGTETTVYQKQVGYITATTSSVRIYLFVSGAGAVYVDNISVKEVDAADSTPYANTGTVYGAAYTTDAHGNSNNALSFNGTSDYISIPDTDTLSFGNSTTDSPFSISVWVKMDDATGFQVMGKGTNETREWLFYVDSSDLLRMNLYDNDSSNLVFLTSTASLTADQNTWIHVVATYDGSGQNGMTLYRNGVSVAATSSLTGTYVAMHNQAQSAVIGRNSANGTTYANGSISDVRIYNRALSATEVKYLYDRYAKSISTGSLNKGLVFNMPLDDESDKVSNEYNITDWDMEVAGTGNWTAVNGGSSAKVADERTGGAGAQSIAVTRGTSDNGSLKHNTDIKGHFTVGKRYRLSGWIKNINATDGRIQLWVAGSLQGVTLISSSTSWTKVSKDFEFLTGATTANIYFIPTGSAGQIVRFDDIRIVDLSTADTTPNANDGVLYMGSGNGGITTIMTTDRHGQSNKAMDFDGTNDYISIPDTDTLSFGNSTTDEPFSVSAWVKMDEATSFWALSKGSSAAREYVFGSSGSDLVTLLLYDNVEANNIRGFSAAITSYEGQWIHLVGTYDGSGSETGIEVYINGVLSTDTQSESGTYVAMHNQAQAAIIGRNWTDGTAYANGSIADVRVYDRELSAAEVKLLYESYRR